MKLIKQSNSYDCGQACLAMVSLSDIDYIKKTMARDCTEPTGIDPPLDRMGVCEYEMSWFLYRHNIKHHIFYPRELFDKEHYVHKGWDKLTICSMDELNGHLQAGGAAILGVPSLNYSERGHWIVMFGGRIFDPSTEKTYRDGDKLKIDCAVIIGEWQNGDA